MNMILSFHWDAPIALRSNIAPTQWKELSAGQKERFATCADALCLAGNRPSPLCTHFMIILIRKSRIGAIVYHFLDRSGASTIRRDFDTDKVRRNGNKPPIRYTFASMCYGSVPVETKYEPTFCATLIFRASEPRSSFCCCKDDGFTLPCTTSCFLILRICVTATWSILK